MHLLCAKKIKGPLMSYILLVCGIKNMFQTMQPLWIWYAFIKLERVMTFKKTVGDFKR